MPARTNILDTRFPPTARDPVHTYVSGHPYRYAQGRQADRDDIENLQPLSHSVVSGSPTADEFIRAIHRELKIRMYQPNSIKNYVSQIRGFVRWFGNAPNKITREDVRCYLETLVDGGASASQLAVCLSAIRTAFDKMCCRDITLGLVTPRRPKQKPVILSQTEVTNILAAAPTSKSKLAIGIMYAAGLRNSELCRLRVRDIDFDRATIAIRQGKGNSDRLVMLPQTFRQDLHFLCNHQPPDAFLFPSMGSKSARHLSPRTLQRWVKLAAEMAGVSKRVTPHTFRHAFATHLLENGTDIRFIQKLLGHRRLETTTIYTHVANIKTQAVISPLDQSRQTQPQSATANPSPILQNDLQSSAVASLKFHFQDHPETRSARVTLEITGLGLEDRVFLTGIKVAHSKQQWLELTLPHPQNWAETLNELPSQIQKRTCNPEFYELIRAEVSRRFLNRSSDW